MNRIPKEEENGSPIPAFLVIILILGGMLYHWALAHLLIIGIVAALIILLIVILIASLNREINNINEPPKPHLELTAEQTQYLKEKRAALGA